MEALLKFLILAVVALVCMSSTEARPDSAGHPPEGFAYGGIPYGSMSGNVAEYYRMKQAVGYVGPFLQPAANIVHYPHIYNNYYHL